VLVEKLFNIDDVAKVGDVLAIIETDGDHGAVEVPETAAVVPQETAASSAEVLESEMGVIKQRLETSPDDTATERFYSPLVKNIAKQENITTAELEGNQGTGKVGRVYNNDILLHQEGKDTILPRIFHLSKQLEHSV